MFIRSAAIAATFALPVSAQEGKTVHINGMDLYYEVSGEGDPLVVLHGAYMNVPAMGGIIPALARTHRVYALEFQGHGRTGDIPRPITYLNLGDDVAAFMEAVGLQQADVFGYSMGAGAALQLAIRHPGAVDHLILASVSYDQSGWAPEMVAMIPQMTPEMFTGTPMETAWAELAPDPDPAIFRSFVEKMIALEHEPQHWGDQIEALDLPVLLIAGDADVVTLGHMVDMFHLFGGGVAGDMGQPLSQARLAILPASSHTSVIGQVDLLRPMIEMFLADEQPKGMFD